MAITERQKRFCDEYLIDLNATQAAVRAGYKATTDQRASEIGYQLLQKTPVREYIQQRQKDLQKRTEITQERVLQEYARIGFADIRKAVKWSPSMQEMVVGEDVVMTNGVMLVDSEQLDDDTALAISEVAQTKDGIKIKFHDKKAALDSISRTLGLFDDKMKLLGDKENPIKTEHKVTFEVISGNVQSKID